MVVQAQVLSSDVMAVEVNKTSGRACPSDAFLARVSRVQSTGANAAAPALPRPYLRFTTSTLGQASRAELA